MKLTSPLKQYIVSQKFGENANGSYASAKLKGHTGIDMVSFWKDTIVAAVPAYLYSTYNFNNSNFMMYRAVLTLVEEGNTVYEVSYGHCEDFLGTIGTQVSVGDKLALEGNTGDVFVNGVEVTEALKIAGSHSGTHLHFQVRLCEKSDTVNDLEAANGHYITNATGNYVRTSDNKFIHIVNYDNGYNGCIDPAPFFDSLVIPPVPTLPPSPTIDQEKTWLTSLSLWLTNVLNAIKGR